MVRQTKVIGNLPDGPVPIARAARLLFRLRHPIVANTAASNIIGATVAAMAYMCECEVWLALPESDADVGTSSYATEEVAAEFVLHVSEVVFGIEFVEIRTLILVEMILSDMTVLLLSVIVLDGIVHSLDSKSEDGRGVLLRELEVEGVVSCEEVGGDVVCVVVFSVD